MPSAARGFTRRLLRRLSAQGVDLATITLHTGVSSAEAGERPHAEWMRVDERAAAMVRAARGEGRRVIAVGTTVVRALETASDHDGTVRSTQGWTDEVITPERGVRAIDGLLTGWHEPAASHLDLIEAVAGRPTLERSYAAAIDGDYLWHEFGDFHLILP
jgi:S-adenosylmethionine:tRNA ribosyltransferase-isomerase